VKIAIATERKAKLEAVRAAAGRLASLGLRGWEKNTFIPRSVDSGVSATPTSDSELMEGARSRVASLRRLLISEGLQADYYIGLEGGLHVEMVVGKRLVFLRGWVYASNDQPGQGRFGCTPSVELPDEIAEAVLVQSEDLGVVIDRFAGRSDIKSNEGTWGVLTAGLITRGRSFEMATLAALAPYYNAPLYFHDNGRGNGRNRKY
jgi:non-canonical (house-cleaning) NTP pyrophosphatase